MFHLLTILGARPQFIKAATISRVIKSHNAIRETIVHTGQHYDENMSKIFFEQMGIPEPDYHLVLGSKEHGAMTAFMLSELEKIIIKEKPDAVLVFGDTNSTLAGAIATSKLHIPLVHVEAGLRSFNRQMPEEVNRILTDHVAQLLMCPTEVAVDNLKNENIPNVNQKVFHTGDVMYDAALFYAQNNPPSDVAKSITSQHKDFVLLTMHRAENVDDENRLAGLIRTLDSLASDIPIIFPVHPRTKDRLQKANIHIKNIHCIEPASYFDMLYYLSNATGVLTDSGGLQKEAYFFGKRCVILRAETEWVELVKGGYAYIADNDHEKIIQAREFFLNSFDPLETQLYKDGKSAYSIVDIILNELT